MHDNTPHGTLLCDAGSRTPCLYQPGKKAVNTAISVRVETVEAFGVVRSSAADEGLLEEVVQVSISSSERIGSAPSFVSGSDL
jgi:hypothetical protein